MFIMFQFDDSIFVLLSFLIGISLLILSCFQKNAMIDLIFDDQNSTIYLQKYGWMHWNEHNQTIQPLGQYHDFKKLSLKSTQNNKKYTLEIEFHSNNDQI